MHNVYTHTCFNMQVLCGKCGNGLGHEFLNDGPDEGLSRFWIFSHSLKFVPKGMQTAFCSNILKVIMCIITFSFLIYISFHQIRLINSKRDGADETAVAHAQQDAQFMKWTRKAPDWESCTQMHYGHPEL